jgi:ABC-type nitrate/sulfonate/bicarbonate transport system permease component
VVLTAELFGGDTGVGYMLNVARQEFDTVTIFAIIFFILIFVAAAEIVFFRPIQARLDRRFARA